MCIAYAHAHNIHTHMGKNIKNNVFIFPLVKFFFSLSFSLVKFLISRVLYVIDIQGDYYINLSL